MITLETRGSSFKKSTAWLERLSRAEFYQTLERFGQEGVAALSAATPADSGNTAAQWSYTIRKTRKSFSIIWTNGNVVSGVPVVILLEYGHGTGTGGYVRGRNFINAAIHPVFDKIQAEFRRAVTTL